MAMDKPNDDKPARWGDRLRRSKRFQDRHNKTWARNKNLVFGDGDNEYESKGAQAPWKSLATVSYGWGLIEALVAGTFAQNPSGVVDPYDKAATEAGALLSNIMRFDFDQMNTRDLLPLSIIDACTVGYSAVIETVEVDKKWIRYPNDAFGKPNLAADPDAAQEGEDGAMPVIAGQRFLARRVHPKDILFDPQGTLLDLSDSDWCAVAFYPTITQLKADPTFKGNLPEGIDKFPECHSGSRPEKGDASSKPTLGLKGSDEEEDPDFRRICVWEIHDKVNKQLVYVTDYGEIEIGTAPWPAQLRIGGRDLFAITLFAFHPDTEGIYPKAEIDLIANQLVLMNRLDAMIYEDAASKWRKYVMLANMMTPDQAAKFTDPNTPNEIITIDTDSLADFLGEQNKGNVDIARLVLPCEDVAPKRDLLAIREMVMSEMQQILGYGPLDRGGMPKTRSAREAVAVKEQLGARMEPRRSCVERFFQDFGQKHLMFLQQRMEVPRYARIFPGIETKLASFIQYTKEDITGDFEWRVIPNTSTPQTSEARQAMELQLFQTAAPIIQSTGGDIRPAFFRLAEAFGWEGVDALFSNHTTALENMAVLLAKFQTGTVTPQELLSGAAQVVQTGLTPPQIKNIAMALGGGAGAASPGHGTTLGGLGPLPGARGDQNPLGTASGTGLR